MTPSKQKDAVESMDDPHLLASIIKKTALFYPENGLRDTCLPGAVPARMESNYQSGDNFIRALIPCRADMCTAMEILKQPMAQSVWRNSAVKKTHEGSLRFSGVACLFSLHDRFLRRQLYYSEKRQRQEREFCLSGSMTNRQISIMDFWRNSMRPIR